MSKLTNEESRAIKATCEQIANTPDTWVQATRSIEEFDLKEGEFYPAKSHCNGNISVWIEGRKEMFLSEEEPLRFLRFRTPALVA